MGNYLNPGSTMFWGSLRSQIYIDKSGLIRQMNTLLYTEQRYVCVSRPRRFGKSMAANMLAAYYDKENDTKELFAGLKISKDTSFDENINKYDVIKINMQEFLSATQSMDDMLKLQQKRILADLRNKYPEFVTEENLVFVMQDVFAKTNSPFIILIDEWDCLFREYEQDRDAQKKYLDFLRFWLKDKEYINAISTMDWHEVIRSVENSRKLLEDLWNQDAEAVAKGIECAHNEISILQYNNENSLSCTIHLAFYFAREYYTIIRELPTGKGFADVCFIPRNIAV